MDLHQNIVYAVFKPRVRHWLFKNCGLPADLSKLKTYWLAAQKLQSENKIGLKKFTGEVPDSAIKLILPSELFDEITNNCSWIKLSVLEKIIDHDIKKIMLIHVALSESLMLGLEESVIRFQEKFEFSNDIWSYSAIRKMAQRNKGSLKFTSITKLLYDIEYRSLITFLTESVKIHHISKRYRNEILRNY